MCFTVQIEKYCYNFMMSRICSSKLPPLNFDIKAMIIRRVFIYKNINVNEDSIDTIYNCFVFNHNTVRIFCKLTG